MNPLDRNTEQEVPTDLPKASQISNEPSTKAPATKTAEESLGLKQIRTYQGDIASAIEGQDESLFSIQQAERAKQGIEEKSPEEKEEGRNKLKAAALLVGSFVLVGAGIVGGWYAYAEFSKKTELPELRTSPTRLISSAVTAEINTSELNRLDFISAVIEKSTGADLPEGEVLHIELIEEPGTEEILPTLTTSQRFFVLTEANAPGNLVRAMGPIFMLGALEKPTQQILAPDPVATTTDRATTTPVSEEIATSTPVETIVMPNESIFLIFKLESYENAFAGMLEWEANMLEDIGAIFSTREIASNVPPQTPFTDLVTRNKDARVLRTASGEIVLIYSFFDKETLIITDSEDTLRSLLNRLSNELLSR